VGQGIEMKARISYYVKSLLLVLFIVIKKKTGNETIEEIAEKMQVPASSLNAKLAKAIVIHGQDLKLLNDDQLDDILR
jgi:hypothetical protein